MSTEKESIQVGLGQKGDLPAGTELTATEKPVLDEVGGRYLRVNYVNCPYCYAVCRIVEDTNVVRWYTCWNCEESFRF